ncbi:hypothetical protein HanRHA438_Chr02g0089441 [Helianthus annuus]|nr:hypothetical protein HanIR_Chr02g0091011 [Helianthus annuus]KAJ0940978.1 hypothetical protein HanRHA438_Chr02g0089441 [Helianthus annuus]
MLKSLLCLFKFLNILKFIKMCKHAHNLGKSMNLHYVKELKRLLQNEFDIKLKLHILKNYKN